MNGEHAIGCDLANVYEETGEGLEYRTTLAWGDRVELLDTSSTGFRVRVTRYLRQADGSVMPAPLEGVIRRPSSSSQVDSTSVIVPADRDRVLKVDFVDVQQGDGAVIESPEGKVVLIDGGEMQLFARYLATRFPGTSATEPKEIDCIVVSHGDADHFAGLTEIHDSETNDLAYKRLFIRPARVYHNGLVKRPSALPESRQLGPFVEIGERAVLTGLVDDLLAVPDAEMNEPFRMWKGALGAWRERGPIELRRIAFGDDARFDFLRDEDVDVEVLGPLTIPLDGGVGLEFLGRPKRNPRIVSDVVSTDERRFTGKSASHTINGHSVVLRLTFGGFRFLFAGDLNEQSEEYLVTEHRARHLNLRAEVLKVPHHGSHDYAGEFIERVAPVVSVISSGDENERREYIHPRANLVAALGKHSRPGLSEPVLFVTEMVAFFERKGYVTPEFHRLDDDHVAVIGPDGKAVVLTDAQARFFAFERAAFGIVKMRTDGRRLFVWTNSGQQDLKETYAFESAPGFRVEPVLPLVAT
jgi:beta-lactamase superfamily II metal-dependent hydrolase